MTSKESSSSSSSNTKGRSGKTKRGRGGDDDGWGGFRNYMDAKKKKLNEQFHVDTKGISGKIFEGVAIYVNGYTIPSSDELRRLMVQHGGQYEMYLSKTRVTHIIATNLPNSKFHMAKTIPVVKPDWITESVAAQRRLSHIPYLLLGNQSKLQPGLKSFSSISSLSRSTTSSSLRSTGISESIAHFPAMSSFSLEKDLSELSVSTIENSDQVLQNLTHDGRAVCAEDDLKDVNFPLSKSNVDPFVCGVKEVSSDNQNRENKSVSVSVKGKEESDDEIVYNSEEEGNSESEGKSKSNAVSNIFCGEKSPYKRRSRVYSFRKLRKSNSGSFDSPRPIDSSSCDGFIECTVWQSLDNCESVKNKSSTIVIDDTGTASGDELNHETKTTNGNVSVADFIKNLKTLKNKTSTQTDNSMPVSDPHMPGSSNKLLPTEPSDSVAPVVSHLTSSSVKKGAFAEIPGHSVSMKANVPGTEPFPLPATNAPSLKLSIGISETLGNPQAVAKTSPAKVLPNKTPPKSTTMARAGDSNFLNEFYSNSRLHHLSTWGAELKAYVSEIVKSGNTSFTGREKLRQAHVENVEKLGLSETLVSARHNAAERTIMHIDMDCYFVSVGLLSRPDLRGKPVAVTHSKGQGAKPNPGANIAWEKAEWMKKRDERWKGKTEKKTGEKPSESGESSSGRTYYDYLIPEGSTGAQTFLSFAEIASCSYEARKAGVKNGMFMGKATQLCPDLQTIPYNFAEYSRISKILYGVVASYTHDIEAVSCDEMLIDCTDVLTDTGATAMEFARLLREEMMDKTGCPASTGIGPNILLAKLATRRAKPNGQFEVTIGEAKEFIKDQSVSDLPGVGYSMSRKLDRLGVKTCGVLQSIPVATLRREFGPKTGETLHSYSIGQDDRVVTGDKQRKSVSAEVNYGIRFTKEADAVKFLMELSMEVKRRVDAISVKGRSITLKLMVRRPDAPLETAKFMGHGICTVSNKSCNLPVATNDGNLIGREVVSLYRSQKVEASEVRGIGIQINKLESTEKGPMSGNNQTSGHQSILNFAVSKNKTNKTSTAVEMDSVTPASNDTRGSTAATVRSVATPGNFSTSVNSSSTTSSNSLFTKPFTTIRSDRRQLQAQEQFTKPSYRTNETNAAPLQKSNHLKHSDANTQWDNFSSVHTTHSSKGAESTHSNHRFDTSAPSTSYVTDSSRPSTSRDTHEEADVSLLSESQIDSDVLQELPPDIADEIIQHLRQKKEQKQGSNHTESKSKSPLRIQESASGVGQPSLNDQRTESTRNDERTTALPSLSQLDLSCFNALPKQLQQELKAEYARQEVTSQRSVDKMTVLHENESNKMRSPMKDKGPRAPKQASRRGRPPGKKKLNFGVSKSKTGRPEISKKKIKMTSANLDSDIIICDDEDNTGSSVFDENSRDSNYENILAVPPLPSDGRFSTNDVLSKDMDPATRLSVDVEESRNRKDIEEQPTFCGKRSLNDVRGLFKEWLLSGPEPQLEDVSMVTEYIITLVQRKNLELAFYLLQFLARKVKYTKNSQWKECLSTLMSHVQNVLCASYGATFKLA